MSSQIEVTDGKNSSFFICNRREEGKRSHSLGTAESRANQANQCIVSSLKKNLKETNNLFFDLLYNRQTTFTIQIQGRVYLKRLHRILPKVNCRHLKSKSEFLFHSISSLANRSWQEGAIEVHLKNKNRTNVSRILLPRVTLFLPLS